MTRKQSKKTHSAASTPRPSRRIHEETSGKLPDLARCPRCDASYRNGRWTWKPAPAGSYEHVCPACVRIETHHPAGELRVEGAFELAHRDEVVGTLRNVEERERTEHPLKRIAAIEEAGDGLVVTVTDAKLVQSLGRALYRAYEGRFEHPPTTSEQDDFVRARWSRD